MLQRLATLPVVTALGWSLTTLPTPLVAQSPKITFQPDSFVPSGRDPVPVERGELLVPMNRSKAGSPMIAVRFLRFASRAVTPGPPIVYLAGGPGGSGIAAARGPRWALFDMLRDVADVIILDQRGTGISHRSAPCRSSVSFPLDLPSTREHVMRLYSDAVRECAAWWGKEGVDLSGYNTLESAADLEAIRRGLGVPALDLLGISYGTHLALAAIKTYPNSFRRAVLSGPEGLDQTVKLPSRNDGFWRRVQASIDADPAAKAIYPDAVGLIRRVLDRVAKDPVRVTVPTSRGEMTMLIGAFEIQRASGAIADPASTAGLLEAYRRADSGDFTAFGRQAQRTTGEPFILQAMPLAMDVASGISPERAARVAREAETALLADALNFPMPHVVGVAPELDLGESFRAPFMSSTPVLIFSGTLDGRTYPEGAADVAANFRSPAVITAVNGGHNTILVWPEAGQMMKRFFAGESFASTTVTMPAPRWVR
ncbi:MAG: alpha/beta fold hydrolase [Gemmatimonadales bacterium]